MAGRAFLAINASLLSIGWSCTASAQDTAETAQILSSAGQSQGRAAQSLESAFSDSMNAAAARMRSTQNRGQGTGERMPDIPRETYVVPSNADPLEGTDAPTYRQGNGPSIRVSGTLIQAPQTTCSKNCPEVPTRSKTTH